MSQAAARLIDGVSPVAGGRGDNIELPFAVPYEGEPEVLSTGFEDDLRSAYFAQISIKAQWYSFTARDRDAAPSAAPATRHRSGGAALEAWRGRARRRRACSEAHTPRRHTEQRISLSPGDGSTTTVTKAMQEAAKMTAGHRGGAKRNAAP
jgi:hypothetical protein